MAGSKKRLFFVTGRPGTGKTTVIMNAVNELRKQGFIVGGMVTREVRDRGARIGFEIIDVNRGQTGWLAHISQATGPRIGKYKVNLNDLDQVGVKAVQEALASADIVVVDEIGPMELFSPWFKQVIQDTLGSDKPVLGVVHSKARDPLIDSVKKRSDIEIIEVTERNRESLHNVIIDRILELLEERKRAETKV